jgi:hypothetical protein
MVFDTRSISGPGELLRPNCPFVTRINPQLPRAEARGRDWALRVGLLRPHASTRNHDEYVRLAALVHPHADPDGLQIAADWIAWRFLVDDVWDETEHGRQLAHIDRVPAARAARPASPHRQPGDGALTVSRPRRRDARAPRPRPRPTR